MYNFVSCTHNNDEGLTYCFVVRAGKLEAWEAYSTPHMTVNPNANVSDSKFLESFEIPITVSNAFNKN